MFLSLNHFSQLNLFQDLELGARREKRRGPGELERCFLRLGHEGVSD
jgi:hypothetical protein